MILLPCQNGYKFQMLVLSGNSIIYMAKVLHIGDLSGEEAESRCRLRMMLGALVHTRNRQVPPR